MKINHATSPKLYRSYYSHRSRELVSSLCGIFHLDLLVDWLVLIFFFFCHAAGERAKQVILFTTGLSRTKRIPTKKILYIDKLTLFTLLMTMMEEMMTIQRGRKKPTEKR